MLPNRHDGVRDVYGIDLAPGDIIVHYLPDGTDVEHLIDHFGPYPGRFFGDHDRLGDHARRAYFDPTDQHGCTVADHECFHARMHLEEAA